MSTSIHLPLPAVQTPLRKPVDSARRSAASRRPHSSAATLMPGMGAEILGSLRAGRNVEQTRKEFCITAVLAIELAWRDHEHRLGMLERLICNVARKVDKIA